MKKSVPCKGKSPKVDNWDAKAPFKYSTGSKGRAYPSGLGKKNTKGGNPPSK